MNMQAMLQQAQKLQKEMLQSKKEIDESIKYYCCIRHSL